ncbi:MAG: phosphatidylserine/phosphatidylglycerophosphate/cardiolipin synthase family protein [Oscillospiraceae bacterium]|nr:phosphatidylserine/phosphatidylglycerophosphate/cardiolipin synthase family protein [Oscillospiraceae bacterium]
MCYQNDLSAQKIVTYLRNTVGGAPALTGCVYLPCGEDFVAHLLTALRNAERYIFLEYFTIEKGVIWDEIADILEQKAAQGVDVRIICDGYGSLRTLPRRFIATMAARGVRVRVFNPVRLHSILRFNIRDHRKIAAIDGTVALCGGVNLSDRYANVEELFGHWKDAAVKVDGETARAIAEQFAEMWAFLGKAKEEISPKGGLCPSKGRILTAIKSAETESLTFPTTAGSSANLATTTIPVTSSPMADTPVAEHMFINMISGAGEYVYITTPYLTCGSGILSVLSAAAHSGVDVRIIVPFIADKPVVKLAGESYYSALLINGVRLFEYTRGFIHAKIILADGKRAMVGSVNLDYRSLYLNHENAVFVFGETVGDITRDVAETLSHCKEITLEDVARLSVLKRALRRFCRLFARFM